MPSKHVRITDVAAQAGVSIATVSHVLSGRRPVSESTRRRVQAVIDEMGYRPSAIARSMVTQQTHTVALIIPDITNPFYPAIARGLQDVLTPAGYFTLVVGTDANPDTERQVVEHVIARRVDAIGFAGYYKHFRDVEPAVDAGIPVVLLGSRNPRPGVDTVSVDDFGAGALATQHLIDHGYDRIAFITGPAGQGPPGERVAGYTETLAENGRTADPQLVVRTQFNRDGGRAGMRRLLELPDRPRAVICTNDVVAIGAMDSLREAGLRCPDDVAVIGFDDIEAASLVSPPLTTILIPAREEGAACARLLLHRLDDDARQQPPQSVMFSATLVRRESA